MEKRQDKKIAAKPEQVKNPAETPVAGNEKDADELVHSENNPVPETIAKHDPDEAIHLVHKETTVPGQELDVDDIIHHQPAAEEDI